MPKQINLAELLAAAKPQKRDHPGPGGKSLQKYERVHAHLPADLAERVRAADEPQSYIVERALRFYFSVLDNLV